MCSGFLKYDQEMNIVSSNINSRVHHCSLGLYHLPLKAYRCYQNPSKEPHLIPVCVFVTCEFEVLQAVESKDVFRPAYLTDIPFRLYFQFYYLPGYYQALLVTGMILLTVIEVVRIYLGYIGNLKERVIQTNIVSEAERRDPGCGYFSILPEHANSQLLATTVY